MMEIQISNSSKTQLLTTDKKSNQPFLILNVIGSNFLLIKAKSKSVLDKNMVFSVDGKQFYSTFARHVNLSYAGKLSEVVESLDILFQPGLQHQWLVFYQIHDYFINDAKIYKIQSPVYGSEVFIHFKNGQVQKSFISNMLRLHGQTFYFMSAPPATIQQFAIITDVNNHTVYGITYFVKDVTICLPFQSICSQKPCPMNISPLIRPLLARTCYIRNGSSYCTGFVRNEKQVISVRHVLSFENQKIGVEVGIRFYPYTQQKTGFISRIGEGGVDIISIKLTNNLISKTPTANLEQKSDQFMGKQILALGFGKFGYSPKIFNRIDIVMPTIQIGNISKLIKLGKDYVFIKTDASLYNGFSGCGLWMKEQLVGMAVFILKNKNNNSMFNRHNFSYSSDFIFKLLDGSSKQFLKSQINAELMNFDKIQTRFFLPLLPKL